MDGLWRIVGGGRSARRAAPAPAAATAVAFKPDQRGRLANQPAQAARTGVNRILLIQSCICGARPAPRAAQRNTGLFLQHLSRTVPDFDLRGELPGGIRIRERLVDVVHDDVFPIRRHARRFNHRRLADGRRGAGYAVHNGELGRGVVFEQILIVRILQQIFIGGSAPSTAQAFRNVGTYRNCRRRGRGTAIGGYCEYQQRFTVGSPLQGAAPAAGSAPASAAAPSEHLV